jgi:2',3'-cyclic-nucleotide 2'-phosphodiesterase (5'-nucleotidase family)
MMESQDSSTSSLPWNDVNILVVTDVHSWVAGHGEHPEEHLNADYGDVLSFYQRLRQQQQGMSSENDDPSSLFFVMNGDFMDGTGLSTIPPRYLTPLLQEMPWDAVNVGNHELYFDDTVQHLVQSGFIEHWNGTYLSSNTVLSATQEPLGNRYTFLHGRSGNVTLLTFGFLYNFLGHCASTNVERVEQVVQQQWFRQVLRHPPEPYHAILVLAHMDCVDSLVSVILQAIRQNVGPSVQVLFITGHSHRRAFAALDDHAASFEAGRFLDTIGWVSFSIPSLKQTSTLFNATTPFEYRFLDANKQSLYSAIGTTTVAEFETPAGRALAQKIRDTQQSLGLHNILGCSSHTYSLEAGFESSKSDPSLWWLYIHEIIPQQLLHRIDDHDPGLPAVFVQGTGAFRYSLLRGKITKDDVIAVCPFNDKIYQFDYPVRGQELLQILDHLEGTFNISTKYDMPAFATVPLNIDANTVYRVIVPDFEYKRISPFIDNVTTNQARRVKTPKQVCFRDECLHTLDLWMNHVQEQMPCLLKGQRHFVSTPGVGSTEMAVLPSLRESSLLKGNTSFVLNEIHLPIILATILLAAIVLAHLTASIMNRQKPSRNDTRQGEVGSESEELLATEEESGQNICYGSMPDNMARSFVTLNFSQTDFNSSAGAIVQALSRNENVSEKSWQLCQWEVCHCNTDCGNLYLCHPPITAIGLSLTEGQGTNSLEENDLEDSNVITDNAATCNSYLHHENSNLIRWSFSIVYSDTYCVPILYFHVQHHNGTPCSRQQVLKMLLESTNHSQADRMALQDTWDFVSQEQHPFTNMPSFFLHPCQSSTRLQLLLSSTTSVGQFACNIDMLWTWMSMILPTVGHPIPPSVFLKIQEQLILS